MYIHYLQITRIERNENERIFFCCCDACIFSLVGIQRRVSQGLKVLQYYTTKNWVFKNEKFLHMKDKMSPKDQETFYFSVEEVPSSL